ncbi:hypothetical protein [Planctomycetes bacterium K23_9]|uniref:Uncharacterized protein n=1 Tax=Stieleria marina TaxID=1930275 RepID=A0A517P0M3_9BACT|nr:hypothetical protein K239x_49400 [Planctomycetes bacterium K23_9]
MSQQNTLGRLPSVIEHKLRWIQRRQLALTTARGIAIGLGVLLVGMIVAMTADWLIVLFSPSMRTVLTIATVGTAITAAILALVGPLRKAWDIRHAARCVDAQIPNLQERWSTVTELSQSGSDSGTDEEQSMQAQVTSEAVAMHTLVKPSALAPLSSIRRPLIGLSVCGFALAAFMSIYPQQTWVLWQRFWSPTQNITATKLLNQTSIQIVPRGELVDLAVRQTGVPRIGAELTLEYPSGQRESLNVAADADDERQFIHSIRADESFRYRMRAGDGQTQWQTLKVIDYPELGEVKFKVVAPTYVGRPDVEKGFVPRRIKVIQGTTLQLSIRPKEALKQLVLLTTSQASDASAETSEIVDEIELHADADGWYHHQRLLQHDILLEPKLLGLHGLQNENRATCRIEAIADAAPIARVISPTEEMAVADDEVIEIEFEAHDDHGIAKAELVIYDDSRLDENGEPLILDTREIPLGDQKLGKHFIGATQLDLKEFELQKDAQISYSIRVTDNRDAKASESGLRNDQEPSDRIASTDSKPSKDGTNDPGSKVADADQRVARATSKQQTAEQRALKLGSTKPAGREGDDLASQMTKAASKESAEKSSPTPSDLASGSNDQSNKDAGAEQAHESMSPLESMSPVVDAKNPGKDELAAAKKTKATSQDRSAPKRDESDAKTSDQTASNAKGDASNPNSRPRQTAAANRKRSPDDTTSSKLADNSAASSPKNQPPTDTSDKKSSKPTTAQLTAMASGTRSSVKQSLAKSGQNTETNRRRLKITERLTAIATADEIDPVDEGDKDIRRRVVEIDQKLALMQTALKMLVDHRLPDSTRGAKFTELDQQIGAIQDTVTELRNDTKENEFAFVGLQMVDISRYHITPARDRIFAAIRRPGASDLDAKVALGNISRARERLDKLLKKYDRVKRDEDYKKSIEETAEMYDVIVEKSQKLLREFRQNRNPMSRRMSIIEVDQDYLDQLAENLRLRREMLKELGRMLGDDPRLLSRYLDLTRRRNQNMRSRLSDLAERQDEATVEMMGWIEIDDQQRDDLWNIIAEMRVGAVDDLASDIADFTERVTRQMPLIADADRGTPAQIIHHADAMAQAARLLAMDAEKLLQQITPERFAEIQKRSEALVVMSDTMEAYLDQLQVEHDDQEEISVFVSPRLLENRIVGAKSEAWAMTVQYLSKANYASIAAVEQHELAIETQELRMEMQNIQAELAQEFTRQVDDAIVPVEVTNLVSKLHRVMESITFNQVAATIAAKAGDLERSSRQQQLALKRLAEAEDLFDQMRRAVVDALDQYDEPNPSVADLRDPTLDEFLARLEREPNIAAQLGLPRRRRNLRIQADAMMWQQQGASLLGSSGDAARARVKRETKINRQGSQAGDQSKPRPDKTDSQPMTKEQQDKIAQAKRAQQEMEKSLLEIETQAASQGQSAKQKERLLQIARQLRELMKPNADDQQPSSAWQKIAQSDQAQSVLAAARRGESIADEQWNKLSSTLEDGLWQVRGKKPPEEYRKAIQHYQDSLRELVGAQP